MTLDEIGIEQQTDKSSLAHDYLSFYEGFLVHLKNEPIRILEIGVLNGASLATWERFFLNAAIIGADINPKVLAFKRERVEIEIIDQSNIDHLTSLCVKHGPFDLIIEDGSHMWEHQITSLRTLFPFVRPRGFYIVEDLQTNYGSYADQHRGISKRTCMEFLKEWLDLKVSDDAVDINKIEDPFLRTFGRNPHHITFYRRACLIQRGD